MKKLWHLGVYILLVFLSVYLPELGIMHLTKFLEWGIDGYYSISAVGEVTLLVMFVCFLRYICFGNYAIYSVYAYSITLYVACQHKIHCII